MSLRALAQQHLAEMAKSALSQRDKPNAVPAGQTAKSPYLSLDTVVLSSRSSEASGLSYCPVFCRPSLQRRADSRNIAAAREGKTDRWCLCGGLARLAWSAKGRREVWRCDDCVLKAKQDDG